MGRKGVSKRKPKQSPVNPAPEARTNSGRGVSKDEVKAEAYPPLATGKSKPSAGSDKKGKKR